ncbi:hypothetical protein J2R76_004188 [Bradyrhizobium sp. USDA 4532]|uniref:hypothetical protein n=1 Tax=unclassified Bradyrhizobium TaxID=2631580 RepID=UPI00209F7235|nr:MULTISPECIES: hypothetical protein [unclassified Bradyrhizobium]MCP1835849.1 hypothetical protein [Bradyrhizobium sp. USDA 4545]MCP1920597.1 hypothetical protein [Bradyrhizobium sp. USDA 4532]
MMVLLTRTAAAKAPRCQSGDVGHRLKQRLYIATRKIVAMALNRAAPVIERPLAEPAHANVQISQITAALGVANKSQRTPAD